MGRIVVAMMVSLDGYVEGANGSQDWHDVDEPLHLAMNELAAGADALVYGRKVYEVMIPYWPEAAVDSSRPAFEQEFGRLFIEKPKLVFTHGTPSPAPNVEVFADDFSELARRREASSGYLLSFGGPTLIDQLLAAGLVDEICSHVNPVVLGSGRALICRRTPLRHIETKPFPNGVVRMRHEVIR